MTFLTVLTRHMSSRPNWLQRNEASLQLQSDPDYEQLVLIDDVGRGFDFANEMLVQAAPAIRGDYVLMLDDDDVMEAVYGIAWMKDAVAEANPPALIFRGDHADLGILPNNGHWRQPPVTGQIGSFDFILRRDVFQAHVGSLRTGGYCSDGALIEAVWAAHGPEVAWLDLVICRAPQRSIGRAE